MLSVYAVIDTNVIVSSLLKKGSIPWILLNYINNDFLVPIYNEEIIKEYKEVLNREKFNFNKDDLDAIFNIIYIKGLYIPQCKEKYNLIDNDDLMFYKTYKQMENLNKGCFLITGNIKHFPKENFIVAPREMVNIFDLLLNKEI